MGRLLVACLVLLALLAGYYCRRKAGAAAAPVDLKAEHLPAVVRDGSSGVALYEYRGEKVLYVEPRGFDLYNEVYRLDGARLGAPSGGIAGDGDGQLPDWGTEARFVRQLREKPKTL
jgi:hypothetical protein